VAVKASPMGVIKTLVNFKSLELITNNLLFENINKADKTLASRKDSQAANSLQDPISKKPITKKGWWSGSDIGPEFKSQY
jgi:hypothetical protein